ncbi:hypothetical protein HPSJM_01695 [Helicobacter pylori SJM180]|nr:hypothetical protein HPSJM_01695 [Helicobacter pylori SJM180]
MEGFNFFEAFVLNPLSFWGILMKNLFSFEPFVLGGFFLRGFFFKAFLFELSFFLGGLMKNPF